MKNYTVGFCFNEALTKVVLINKLTPAWQKGLLNGVGGKLEGDETYLRCMQREFAEEAGLFIEDWRHFASFTGHDGWEMQIFYTVELDHFNEVWSREAEQVEIVDVKEVQNRPCIENIKWLIPLAINIIKGIIPKTATIHF